MYIVIRGKRYEIKHSNLLREKYGRRKKRPILGRCNDNFIYIPHDGDTKDELDTIFHEILHKACPYLDEDEVAEVAGCVTDAAWRFGWRNEQT